jgi:hypothetical protein
MSIKKQIEQIVKEIKVYSSHALFALAKQKCQELLQLVEQADNLTRKEALLQAISKKIESIEEEERNFEGVGKATRMSNRELDVVKQLVGVTGEADSNEAAWEVARACLILGQYDQALYEFYRLIDNQFNQASAAKNVLRCHIGMSAVDEAINQYKLWSISGLFTLEQMEDIRTFLQALLYKNNINRLITDSRIENINRGQPGPDDGFIDIIAVKLTVNEDSDVSQETMLEVNYQKGSTFNVVVPKENQAALDYLETGRELDALELYSTSIIFTDRCRVCERSKVESGSRNGDYSVCLTILESH